MSPVSLEPTWHFTPLYSGFCSRLHTGFVLNLYTLLAVFLERRLKLENQGLCQAPCSTLQYTVLHCTAIHWIALHCTAIHCTVLYCNRLHCTALHCTDCSTGHYACTEIQCTEVIVHCCLLHCITLHSTSLEYSLLFLYCNDTHSIELPVHRVAECWDHQSKDPNKIPG